MNMKLSYRDKVVFIVVIVIIILAAGFFLMIKPKFEEIDTAQYNLETVQTKRDETNERIAELPTYIEKMKAIAQEIDGRQGIFMEEQDPYLNEMYVRNAVSSANPTYTSFSTSYAAASAIERYTVIPANILAYENKITADLYNELPQEVYDVYNKVPAPAYPNSTIGMSVMRIEFENEPTLRALNGIIDNIAKDEKTVIVTSIEADKTNDKATCTVVAYSINPLNVEKVMEETGEVKPLETPAE